VAKDVDNAPSSRVTLRSFHAEQVQQRLQYEKTRDIYREEMAAIWVYRK
jgi:hypothetical protein